MSENGQTNITPDQEYPKVAIDSLSITATPEQAMQRTVLEAFGNPIKGSEHVTRNAWKLAKKTREQYPDFQLGVSVGVGRMLDTQYIGELLNEFEPVYVHSIDLPYVFNASEILDNIRRSVSERSLQLFLQSAGYALANVGSFGQQESLVQEALTQMDINPVIIRGCTKFIDDPEYFLHLQSIIRQATEDGTQVIVALEPNSGVDQSLSKFLDRIKQLNKWRFLGNKTRVAVSWDIAHLAQLGVNPLQMLSDSRISGDSELWPVSIEWNPYQNQTTGDSVSTHLSINDSMCTLEEMAHVLEQGSRRGQFPIPDIILEPDPRRIEETLRDFPDAVRDIRRGFDK